MLRRALLVAFAAVLLLAAPAAAATYPTGFQEQVLVRGLNQPMAVDWTPDGRTFVLEKSGVLRVVLPGKDTPEQLPVLDLSARVNSGHDRGALGLAVDVDYATNNYVYLLYTYELTPGSPDGRGVAVSQLLRVKVSLTNIATEQKVLLGSYTSGICPTAANTVDCIPSDYDSHSIGTVRQAPDGTIFAGSGDGASYNAVDVRALRALDEKSLAGKVVRIDREGRGLPGHPFCPANTNLDDVCTKVWARGLRNPFRFELRPDGGVAIGDVGWNQTEELNVAPPGGGRSFGWPCYEGATGKPYASRSECTTEYGKPAGTHTSPTLEWCHCNQSASALGGPTYTASSYPAGYQNAIFYGDYAKRFVKRAVPNGNGGFTEQPFATDWMGVDLTTQPGTGDLVYVTPGNFGAGQGQVIALRYSAGNRTPVADLQASATSGLAPLTVTFDGSRSSDPDGDALTYAWDFGDGTTATGAKPAAKTYTKPGTYTVTLTVDDGRGRTARATTTITAGNAAPTATITSPADGGTFRADLPVTLTGTGTDQQDGTLPGSALTWQVKLVHGTHVHPYTDLVGASVTFTPLDDHDADSYYEIVLTAKDSGGLTATRQIRLNPMTSTLQLRSEPAGAPLAWAGAPLTAPKDLTVAVGFRGGLEAGASFTKDGRTYVFDRWSDNGPQSRVFAVQPVTTTLTAIYREQPAPVDPSGPVLALGFDEGTGTTAKDRSGYGNDALLERGAAFAAGGRSGSALKLDGVDDWATVADAASLDLTGAMTLEAWVRPETRDGWRTVMMKERAGWQSYVLYGAADPYQGGEAGQPVGFVDGDGVRGAAPVPLNAWSHLAMTFDGTTQRLYIDGALVASRTTSARAVASDRPLRIGGNAVWGEAFKGLLDDVRVYGRALSAAEVVRDRDLPVGSTQPQPVPGPVPVAAYGFEEASGATTADASTHRAIAQVSGATRLTTGKRGRALSFDGTNDRVIVPDAPQLRMTGQMTLSAWVRPTRRDGWRTVLLKERPEFWQSFALYAAADPYGGGTGGEPIGFVDGAGVRSAGQLPLNAWSHLALTYDGGTERLYVDGALAATRTSVAVPGLGYNAGPLSIGGNGVWGEWFAGAIDEVRLFDRALTGPQVAADMDRTAALARVSGAARTLRLSPRTARGAKRAARREAARRGGKRAKVLRGRRASVDVTRRTPR